MPKKKKRGAARKRRGKGRKKKNVGIFPDRDSMSQFARDNLHVSNWLMSARTIFQHRHKMDLECKEIAKKMRQQANEAGQGNEEELESRIQGEVRQDVDKDTERHETQKELLKIKGISEEPIILFKTKDGKYELGEGWHRTTQTFIQYPDGFIQPNVYIGLNAKWLDKR